jgi:hypothetical protein
MELIQQICATIVEVSCLKKKTNIRPVQDAAVTIINKKIGTKGADSLKRGGFSPFLCP